MEKELELELPPGFRFHPTDEELITHYLSQKVLDSSFYALAISDVDLNKGERKWAKENGISSVTNRATDAGYWKATGKDKEIYRVKTLVGMKKTLVFYKGRAPKGEKSNWVMHEYRLEGKYSPYSMPKTAKVKARPVRDPSSLKSLSLLPMHGVVRISKHESPNIIVLRALDTGG
ncbi:hypothetical protein CsSME_00005190 [Camellia sinensis var. sinensis]